MPCGLFAVLVCMACGGGSGGTGGKASPPPPAGHNYTTQFSAAENPINEGGQWVNGEKTGLLWHDCRTTANFAFGTQPGTIVFDDSECLLNGTWGTRQQAQATVRIVASDNTPIEEVEIRLRSSITANSSTGYEVNCSVKAGNPYMQIVRWDGGLGSFTPLNSASVGCADGDVLKAIVTGSGTSTVITGFKNGVQQLTTTDSGCSAAWCSLPGQPGIGFYIQSGSSATNSDFGFSSFSATDQF